ncbi:hypothetical protein NY2A_b329R [Paramecium bursaria Chlorella virus NY2A]|uniref:Uncharacterized protein b329R n=1 Tax=Paramecium bursaria Chlorella virus NY2A TaxID=46021 RepID=A7IWK4_PBCVN|nr:hypothetical protein NY2A_b329R [Paramecium bursaria Chlorella virus NY2A]ABT14728.1 hypothetical protein NY2A_b329R [Paramecium bursaria Chlorella virus NY2A]
MNSDVFPGDAHGIVSIGSLRPILITHVTMSIHLLHLSVIELSISINVTSHIVFIPSSIVIRPRLRVETGEFRDIVYQHQFSSDLHSTRFVRFQHSSCSCFRYRYDRPMFFGYFVRQSGFRFFI